MALLMCRVLWENRKLRVYKMQPHIHFSVQAAASNLIRNNFGEWEKNNKRAQCFQIRPKSEPQSVYHTNKFVNKTSITLCAP